MRGGVDVRVREGESKTEKTRRQKKKICYPTLTALSVPYVLYATVTCVRVWPLTSVKAGKVTTVVEGCSGRPTASFIWSSGMGAAGAIFACIEVDSKTSVKALLNASIVFFAPRSTRHPR